MSFKYLLDKLDAATICSDPFRSGTIENFLDQGDFEAVTTAPDITLPAAANIVDMYRYLMRPAISRWSFQVARSPAPNMSRGLKRASNRKISMRRARAKAWPYGAPRRAVVCALA